MKLFFFQNDPIMGESFWQNNSLVTHILFELQPITRAAGMYEDIRTGPPHVFRIQLTLSQPGGQIMPTSTVLQSSPRLKYVPAAIAIPATQAQLLEGVPLIQSATPQPLEGVP